MFEIEREKELPRECKCICHMPGMEVKHIVACCNQNYTDSNSDQSKELGSDDASCRLEDEQKPEKKACNCYCHVFGTGVKTSHIVACCSARVTTCPCRECLTEAQDARAELMIVCQKCGNKRCPHANSHRFECTGSNERGQIGSAYE